MALPDVAAFHAIAQDILDVVVAAMGAEAPPWQAVTPGRPAHELCTTDQVAVNLERIKTSGPLAGSSSRTVQNCMNVTVADYALSVILCVKPFGAVGGSGPSPTDQTADALRLARAMRLAWYGITQAVKDGALADGCTAINFTSMDVSQPSGGKVAAVMLLTVQP